MELTLTRTSDSHVAVACGGAPSHAFDLRTLMPDETIPGRPPQPLFDPITYGKCSLCSLRSLCKLPHGGTQRQPQEIL